LLEVVAVVAVVQDILFQMSISILLVAVAVGVELGKDLEDLEHLLIRGVVKQ
jgi:hypothetical protein